MKKIIFSALAVLFGAFVFVSCSKEDKESNLEKDIIGSWEMARTYFDDEGEWYDRQDYEYTETYKFNNNGTGSYIYVDDEETERVSFTYTIINKKLSIVFNDDDYGNESYTIESIKSKKMIWKFEYGKYELKKK